MGSLRKAFGTDKKKENEGVWIEILKNDDGTMARMKIRRLGPSNKEFQKLHAQFTKNLKTIRGDAKADMENMAFTKAFVDACLVEWENIENIHEIAPGQVAEKYMPLTKENALSLFEHLPDLLSSVVLQATELEAFQSEVNEEVTKNSFPSLNPN